jgi:hypothetical protein
MFEVIAAASRIVLILFTIAICIAFLMRVLEPKEFMILAGMVFSFYFTKTNINGSGHPAD